VVADGPAIYGMFRIISRSRRNAKGAGYGWLLVTCGTAASIGGNVAHAQPNLVAQAIAAAIPLAVLAMLEGLKGDAGEVTRLTAQAPDLHHAGALEGPGQLPQGTTVRRTDTTPLPDIGAAAGGSRRPALPAGPSRTDRSMVRARLQTAYAQQRPDGQPWTARTLAEAAGCGRSSAASFLHNASAHQSGSTPSEPPQLAASGRRARLCLSGHPGAAPALPTPPPPRRAARHQRRTTRALRAGHGLLVSGSELRPGRQAPPGQPGPPRAQGRHHQSGPGAGLVDPTSPGQHRPGLRPPLRRPGRRRPHRRPGHPNLRRPACPPQLRAAGPDRWRRLASLSGPNRPRQQPPEGLGAGGLAGRGGYVVAPPSRHVSGHPYQWVAGRDLDTPLAEVPPPLLERLQHRQAGRPAPIVSVQVGNGPGPRYGQAALAQELTRVATAPHGQRNQQLWEAARNLYNLVATGALDQREVRQGLLQAAERCGLLADEPRQTHRTLASGRQIGLAHPRPAPDPTHPDPTHASPPPPARTGGERTQEGR
jgi:bifunctional DNA primase/polymerase-like protein